MSENNSTTISPKNIKYEEPWNSTIENYIRELIDECSLHSGLNNEAWYHFKNKRLFWDLGSTIVPTISAPLILMIGYSSGDTCDTVTFADYANACALICTGFMGGVSTFFNYPERMNKHAQVALLYDQAKAQMSMELIKGRSHRNNADVFMMEMNMKIGSIMREEPMIPKGILTKNKVSKEGLKTKRGNNSVAASRIVTPQKHGVRFHPNEQVGVGELRMRKIENKSGENSMIDTDDLDKVVFSSDTVSNEN